MADKAARKTPVRTAPQRKDYPSEVAWLDAKLQHALAEEDKANKAKVERIEKRIASVQKQRAELDSKLSKLEAERTALINGTADWSDDDHLAAEGKA
jgi:chromosome segregation ATPase